MADLVLIICSIIGLLIGWNVGSLRVVANIASWFIGFQAARNFSGLIGQFITKIMPLTPPFDSPWRILQIFIDPEAVSNRILQMILFVVIFLVTSVLVRWLARLLDKAFRGNILGLLNRALGAACALTILFITLNIARQAILPLFIGQSWGLTAMMFLDDSTFVMPFVRSLFAIKI